MAAIQRQRRKKIDPTEKWWGNPLFLQIQFELVICITFQSQWWRWYITSQATQRQTQFSESYRFPTEGKSKSNYNTYQRRHKTTTLQFEKSSSTKLERKKEFRAIFVIGASFPILLMAIFFIYAYTRNVTFPHLMKLIMYFSPLTTMDVYSMWSYFPANVMFHWVLFKVYTGMEKSLTEFMELYVETMHGIITKGI